jgi:ribosomal protein L32
MAVPKKRVSRTRKLLRQGQWKLKIKAQALKALSNGRGNKAESTQQNSDNGNGESS